MRLTECNEMTLSSVHVQFVILLMWSSLFVAMILMWAEFGLKISNVSTT